jgi:hypothetical protein
VRGLEPAGGRQASALVTRPTVRLLIRRHGTVTSIVTNI